MTPLEKLIQARTDLVLDKGAFWGGLALKLKWKEDKSCPTCWTDGKFIGYNPDYIEKCTLAETTGLIAHEAGGHCANLHPFRFPGVPAGFSEAEARKLWNDACDYVVNPILLGARFVLPGKPLVDTRFNGMAAEQVFSILVKERRQQKQQQQQQKQEQESEPESSNDDSEPSENDDDDAQDGQGDDETENEDQDDDQEEDIQPGEVRDAREEQGQASKEEQEAEWQTSVLNAAAIAKSEGTLPAGLETLIEEIKHPKIDWRSALRKWFEQNAKNDFSWQAPNKRYIASGLYLPSIKSEKIGLVVVYGDISGSRYGREQIEETMAETAAILNDVRPEKTIFIPADDHVHVEDIQEFSEEDEIVFKPLHGGGGTDFACVFDWIKNNDIEPVCFVGISDLMGSFPDYVPEYPVVWCKTGRDYHAPFGEEIEL